MSSIPLKWSYAEPCYIYIEKNGYVEPGQEAGMSEAGDVIQIRPVSEGEPTASEIAYYNIIKSDLSKTQKEALMMPVFKNDILGGEKIIQRKSKLDYGKLGVNDYKDSVTNAKLSQNISVKPVAISLEP